VTPTASMTDHGQADEQRAAMVEGIAGRHKAMGPVLSADVRRALLKVPRHLFTEGDAETLGIHVQAAIQWQKLSAGDWTAYAADVSRRPGHTHGPTGQA
jgi:hypothetical protein